MTRMTVSLILTLALAGCPGSDTASSGDGSTSGGDGSTSSGIKDLASGARGTGSLTLVSYSLTIGGRTFPISSESAAFGGLGMGRPCTTLTLGACTISTCQPAPAPSDGGIDKAPDAGTISITGGTKTVMLTPQPDGTYATLTDTTSVLWNGGESLTLASPGNVVGAFNITLIAPKPAQLTMPTAPAAGTLLAVNRSADLVISWTGGQGSNVQVNLGTVLSGGSTVSAMCFFPGSGGTATIPSAVLMNLPVNGNASISVYTENDGMMQTGNYDVMATALSFATGNNNQIASYGVKLQ